MPDWINENKFEIDGNGYTICLLTKANGWKKTSLTARVDAIRIQD